MICSGSPSCLSITGAWNVNLLNGRKTYGGRDNGGLVCFSVVRFTNLAIFRSFLLSIYNLQVLPTTPLKTFKTQFRHTKAQMTSIICWWFVWATLPEPPEFISGNLIVKCLRGYSIYLKGQLFASCCWQPPGLWEGVSVELVIAYNSEIYSAVLLSWKIQEHETAWKQKVVGSDPGMLGRVPGHQKPRTQPKVNNEPYPPPLLVSVEMSCILNSVLQPY